MEHLLLPPEGNVFESIDTRRYIILIIELRVLVFADAATAVARALLSWEAPVDDAFPIQT